MKKLGYKDIQISAAQKMILDSDDSWFTPDTIHRYQAGGELEEQVLPVEPVVNNGQDHPPLSSPEEEGPPPVRPTSRVQEGVSQFETQIPPMLSESDLRNAPAKANTPSPTKPPTPTPELPWTPSPPRVAARTPVSPMVSC
jgi:hypothetical protein